MRTFVKILIAAVILILVVIFMTVPYFFEQPSVTVDYFSQYNQLTRPADYTEADNAAVALQNLPVPKSAEDYSMSMSMNFLWSHDPTDYPDTFSPEEITQFKDWINQYAETLEALIAIAKKPYYYRPLDVSRYRNEPLRNHLYGYDENIEIGAYEIQRLLKWAVVYYLEENDQPKALEYARALLTFSKFFEPVNGPYYYYEANDFITFLNPDKLRTGTPNAYASETLAALQTILTTIDIDVSIDNDYRIEEICFLDTVQKLFTKGDKGHLSTPALIESRIGYLTFGDTPEVMQCIYQSMNCERRKQTLQRMQNILAELRTWSGQSLYQLHQQGIDVEARIEELAGGNIVIEQYLLPELNMPYRPERFTCRSQAAATVIALFRYHRQEGRFPDTLQILIDDDFLDRLPPDPYADGTLVYRRDGDEFILYSVGVDFEDDGGRPSVCKNCGSHLTDWGDGAVYYDPALPASPQADPKKDEQGDHVFWPILEMNTTP